MVLETRDTHLAGVPFGLLAAPRIFSEYLNTSGAGSSGWFSGVRDAIGAMRSCGLRAAMSNTLSRHQEKHAGKADGQQDETRWFRHSGCEGSRCDESTDGRRRWFIVLVRDCGCEPIRTGGGYRRQKVQVPG